MVLVTSVSGLDLMGSLNEEEAWLFLFVAVFPIMKVESGIGKVLSIYLLSGWMNKWENELIHCHPTCHEIDTWTVEQIKPLEVVPLVIRIGSRWGVVSWLLSWLLFYPSTGLLSSRAPGVLRCQKGAGARSGNQACKVVPTGELRSLTWAPHAAICWVGRLCFVNIFELQFLEL